MKFRLLGRTGIGVSESDVGPLDGSSVVSLLHANGAR